MRRSRVNRTRQIILEVDGSLTITDLLDLVGKRVTLSADALTVRDLDVRIGSESTDSAAITLTATNPVVALSADQPDDPGAPDPSGPSGPPGQG